MNSNTNTIRTGPDFGLEGSSTGGVLSWAGQRLESLRRHQQRRLAIRELSRLSDWRLQDMGIERGQIAQVVDGLMARQGPTLERGAD